MELSSVKRMTNEMTIMENESVKLISSEKYYVVRVTFDRCDPREIAELSLYATPQPSAVYFTPTEVMLIFASSDDEVHHLEGDHVKISSCYVKDFARYMPESDVIEAKIVEFDTPMHVVAYIGWVIVRTSQNEMIYASKGAVTETLARFRTEKELCDALLAEKVVWKSISTSIRYGTILHERDGVDEMSGQFDARESARYINFIFG